MTTDELPDYVGINERFWDDHAAEWFAERARDQWSSDPRWGTWGIPQDELPVFPDDIKGLDVVDLGCGVGYVSGWAKRLGARPVGVDGSAKQLATARAMQDEFGVFFPLLHANAERVPLPGASADLVISEYGASTWCDPYLWIPEAARLLRPGGELVFVRAHQILELCSPPYDGVSEDVPVGTELVVDLFGLKRIESRAGEIRFYLPHGEQLRLLRSCGFVVEDLIEVRAPEGATSPYTYATVEWGRRWPVDEVWKARLAG